MEIKACNKSVSISAEQITKQEIVQLLGNETDLQIVVGNILRLWFVSHGTLLLEVDFHVNFIHRY